MDKKRLETFFQIFSVKKFFFSSYQKSHSNERLESSQITIFFIAKWKSHSIHAS